MKLKTIIKGVVFVSLFGKVMAFNPIMPDNLMDNVYSFRALSSSFMFHDYMDFAQNPLLLHIAEKNAIFTGLSNIGATDFLFSNNSLNDIKFGGVYHSGIGSEGLIFTMRNKREQDNNPLGGVGKTTLDSVVYEDTDLDGYSDRRINKHLYSNAWHSNMNMNFSLSFYLDRDDYGLGFFFGHTEDAEKTINGGDTLNPLGEFVYSEQVINNLTGYLVSTFNGSGFGQESNNFNTSLGGIGADFTYGEKPVRALLLYRDESSDLYKNYSAVLTRDNAPLESDVHLVQETYDRLENDNETRKRVSLSAVMEDSEFDITYALNLGIIMHSGKIGTFFDANSVIHEDQLSDSMRIDIQRTCNVASYSEPEGMGFDGYFTFLKDLELGKGQRMRFGISFYGLKDKIKRHILRSDTIFHEFRDGDAEANDTDDFDDWTYSKVEYDSTYEHTNFTVNIPCGFYMRPKKYMELRFGVLEKVLVDRYQNYIVYTNVVPRTHELIRGDGTHTINKDPLRYGNKNDAEDNITPITNFFYGVGFNVQNNLSIDIMNFSNLTNLNNWQLSIVFKF